MSGKTKRIYKVWDKTEKKYVSLGYNSKATWSVFPSAAIQYSHRNLSDIEVHEFEVNPVMVAIYDKDHNLITLNK